MSELQKEILTISDIISIIKELMKTQTHIATTLDSLSPGMLRIDQSIKELLADVQILARILKYTVS